VTNDGSDPVVAADVGATDAPIDEEPVGAGRLRTRHTDRTPDDTDDRLLRRRQSWSWRMRVAAFVATAVAVAFMLADDRLGWLEYQPGGTAFFTYVRPAFYGLLALGAVVAIRWELAGGVVVGFAAGSIGAIVVNQLIGWHAVLVIALLALPAMLWALTDLAVWSRRRALIGLALAIAGTVAGSLVGEAVYERSFGPTHPASTTPALPPSDVRWVWSGGVTPVAAKVVARIERSGADRIRLALSASGDLAAARYLDLAGRDGPIVTFDADGLAPDTSYRYAIEVDGRLDTVQTGTFRTFADRPASFRFTVGACARVGSNGSVFDAIAAEHPLFHVIAGDFHYGDIPDDDRRRYDEVIDVTLRQPAQAALYRSTPVAYMWDDHDYGADNSDALSPSRLAAMAAYRANVPSYELAGEVSAIYQSFDVGRVRVLMTDARSAREPGVSMLGDDQLEWFLDALVSAARDQALVVWLNPVPWVAEARDGGDDWGGYATERQRIAEVIAESGIDNLLMISGDAHMVAIDDGTNTDYSQAADAGFPLLHAAALDRPGSTKGGPYSEGAIGGSGQYGVVDITDHGEAIHVALRAKRYDGEVLLAYDFDVG
jgi:phosphodiesterase/alkaline phosphatase D-like protein